jgi:hypothetical protein
MLQFVGAEVSTEVSNVQTFKIRNNDEMNTTKVTFLSDSNVNNSTYIITIDIYYINKDICIDKMDKKRKHSFTHSKKSGFQAPILKHLKLEEGKDLFTSRKLFQPDKPVTSDAEPAEQDVDPDTDPDTDQDGSTEGVGNGATRIRFY